MARNFTSANVKGGWVEAGSSIEYEEKPRRSGCVLLVFVALVGVLVFVANHVGMF